MHRENARQPSRAANVRLQNNRISRSGAHAAPRHVDGGRHYASVTHQKRLSVHGHSGTDRSPARPLEEPMQRAPTRRGGDRTRAKPRVQFLGRPHAT
jgi:hypothetical protein